MSRGTIYEMRVKKDAPPEPMMEQAQIDVLAELVEKSLKPDKRRTEVRDDGE